MRGFQDKRQIPVTGEIDRRTLDRLHAMTVTPSHEELYNIEPKPGALDPRCRTGRVMCIDKTSRTLRWVVDGKVLLTMDARFGSTVNDTPTREGLFHVYFMNADHVSQLYGSSMPYAMFFSGGQAVHYSSDFATVGYYGASHGCVNIRDYDGIKWLFSQVRVGDAVVVYWSLSPRPEVDDRFDVITRRWSLPTGASVTAFSISCHSGGRDGARAVSAPGRSRVQAAHARADSSARQH